MIGFTIFSETIIRFSTLKHFGPKWFQSGVMKQIDINKFESTNHVDHIFGDVFGKQICHMYPQC